MRLVIVLGRVVHTQRTSWGCIRKNCTYFFYCNGGVADQFAHATGWRIRVDLIDSELSTLSQHFNRRMTKAIYGCAFVGGIIEKIGLDGAIYWIKMMWV